MKRFAFIVNDLLGGYQQILWGGVQKAAKDLGIQVVTIPGHFFNSPMKEDRPHNCMYDFLKGDNWDGMIMTATSFGAYNSVEQVADFCHQFDPLPFVSIGIKLDKEPSVMVDNRTGLYNLVSHMIEQHGYRELGFIRGPHNNNEAEIRYETFKKVLADHGVELNPDWIAEGDFQPASGYQCMKDIWAHADKPRVVLGANDQMMLGAVDYLEELGVDIPGTLALGGFDDIVESRFVTVPLSTVRQPIEEQAYKSVQLLMEFSDSGQAPQDIVLDTEALFRESCGCFSVSVMNAGITTLGENFTNKAFADGIKPLLKEILVEKLDMNLEHCYACHDIDEVLDLIDAYIKDPTEIHLQMYLASFSMIFSRMKEGKDKALSEWKSVLTGLRLAYLHLYPDSRDKVDMIIQKSYLLISEKIDQYLSSVAIKQSLRFTRLQQSLQKIMEAYDMDQVLTRISEELGGIGFQSFYLVFFKGALQTAEDTDGALPSEAELELVYRDNTHLESAKRSFPSRNFLPGELLEQEKNSSLLVQMILFDDKLIGYMICDTDGRAGDHYESLRSQISSSIRAGLLIDEMQTAERTTRERSEKIQSRIIPMLNAIEEVTRIISEKISMMESTAELFIENKKTFQQTSDSVENIAESARYMIDLIKIIDDISERINILSINASIESARAGAHGRGFGVIAGEVRKLADSTAESANQTSETLKQVVANIKISKESSQKSYATYAGIQDDMQQLAKSLNDMQVRMTELNSFSRDIMTLIES